MKTKKPTLKEKQDAMRLRFKQDELKHQEHVLETYLKCLIEYNMPSMAYSYIQAHELWQNGLLDVMKNEGTSWSNVIFGDKNEKPKTELEKIQSSIEYTQTLIKLAENRINGLTDDKKMKIAKDALIYMKMWLEMPNKFDEVKEKK